MKLVCVEGKEKDRVWEVTDGSVTIGRDRTCDITIQDRSLSRVHAEIVLEGNTWIFNDKDSLNGSYINGDRVMRQVLIPGDLIDGFKILK